MKRIFVVLLTLVLLVGICPIAGTPVDLRCIIFVGTTNQPLNIPKGIINDGAKCIYKNVNNVGPNIFNLVPMCNDNDT